MSKPSSTASSPSTQESSVLFSLDEILQLENERILTEQHERAFEICAAEERERTAAQAREQEQQQRLREIERERQASAFKRREEEARLEGVRLSEIERTRHEVEHQARLSLLAQNQAHEQQLMALSQDQSKIRLVRWLTGVLVASLMLGTVAFYQAQEQQRRTETERLALEQEAQLLRGKISEHQLKIARELGRHGQRNQALIEKLQQDLRRLQARPGAQNSGEAGPGVPDTSRLAPSFKPGKPDRQLEKPPEKACPKGDPMCETL